MLRYLSIEVNSACKLYRNQKFQRKDHKNISILYISHKHIIYYNDINVFILYNLHCIANFNEPITLIRQSTININRTKINDEKHSGN